MTNPNANPNLAQTHVHEQSQSAMLAQQSALQQLLALQSQNLLMGSSQLKHEPTEQVQLNPYQQLALQLMQQSQQQQQQQQQQQSQAVPGQFNAAALMAMQSMQFNGGAKIDPIGFMMSQVGAGGSFHSRDR